MKLDRGCNVIIWFTKAPPSGADGAQAAVTDGGGAAQMRRASTRLCTVTAAAVPISQGIQNRLI